MFDTRWVAVPVDASLPWDAHLPPPLECGEEGWEIDPGWADLADLDWNAAAEDAAEYREPGKAEHCQPGGLWAVPGVAAAGDSDGDGDSHGDGGSGAGGSGAGGLSRAGA